MQSPRISLYSKLLGEPGRYTFNEISHDTVARFIEWTYRGDYTEDEFTPMEVPQLEQPNPKSPQSEPPNGEHDALHAHTLLCHQRVYIFSDTYLITDLKDWHLRSLRRL